MLLCLLLFWSMCCAIPHSCILLFLVWICIKIIFFCFRFDYTPSCALLAQHPWQNSRPTKWVILVAFFFLFCFVYPVQFLCLEQKDRSLEDHTRDFLDLACLTHFLDQSFCVFYVTSLSERCKARLPANGPKEEDFAALVESHFQTRDQPAVIPLLQPEPTADGELEPSATEPVIATEPVPQAPSDQVRELATSSVPEGVLVVIEAWREAPPTLPQLRGSGIWFLGVLKRNSWTFSRWT